MPLRAIVFDIEGTLIDSSGLHIGAWHDALLEQGHAIGRAAIAEHIGKERDQLLSALLPGIREAEIEALSEKHDLHYQRLGLPNARPFSKAPQLLQHAGSRGIKVVLASSATRQEVEHYLELLDAQSLADVAVSGNEAGVFKPASEVLQAALHKLQGIRLDEVIAVGDTPNDMQSAARYGIRSLAVRSGGFKDEVLRAARASTVVDNVREILFRFDELFVDEV